MPSKKIACPGCGFLTLSQKGKYEICSFCQWEDDPSQSKSPKLAGGANEDSLADHQKKVLKKYPLSVKKVRVFERAKGWKPA